MSKYVIIVTENGIYDCILYKKIYNNKDICLKEIEEAEKEDKKHIWNYKYEIVEVE